MHPRLWADPWLQHPGVPDTLRQQEIERQSNGEALRQRPSVSVREAHPGIVGPAAPATAATACRPRGDHIVPLVDASRRLLHQGSCSAALWLDGLFGPMPSAEAARGTHGYLETSYEYSAFWGMRLDTRFHVETELPNLKERLSVYVGRDDEDDVVRDRSESFAAQSRFGEDGQREWLAGIGYRPPSRAGLSSDIRAGVTNLREPRAFVQYRLRYIVLDDEVELLQPRLTPFYNTRDGLGVTAGVDYNRLLGADLLLRLRSSGTVSERLEGLGWQHSAMLYIHLQRQRALIHELYFSGETDAAEPQREYGVRQIYQQPLITNKLFIEGLVGYGWPRTDPQAPRDGAYELGVSLRLPFYAED